MLLDWQLVSTIVVIAGVFFTLVGLIMCEVVYTRLRDRYPPIYQSLSGPGQTVPVRRDVGRFIWSTSYRALNDRAITICVIGARLFAVIVAALFGYGLLISLVRPQ